jgi:hypothetical protein
MARSSGWAVFKRLLLRRKDDDEPSDSNSSETVDQPIRHSTLGATSFVDVTKGITIWSVTKMVAMMSAFLLLLYTFSEHFYLLDVLMYFVVAPQQLVAFFDPYLSFVIPARNVRVPALAVVSLSLIYNWVENRYCKTSISTFTC